MPLKGGVSCPQGWGKATREAHGSWPKYAPESRVGLCLPGRSSNSSCWRSLGWKKGVWWPAALRSEKSSWKECVAELQPALVASQTRVLPLNGLCLQTICCVDSELSLMPDRLHLDRLSHWVPSGKHRSQEMPTWCLPPTAQPFKVQQAFRNLYVKNSPTRC
jgi:hypothetical protein